VLERTQKFAKELVGLKPDVIFAGNTPAVVALQEETRTIPIIFANLSDPVDTGLVPNLAHPGGNVTGFASFQYSMAGKWLEILREAIPSITRVALLFNPDTAPFAQKYIEVLRTSGAAFGVETIAAPVREVGDLEPTIAAEGREPGGSVVVMPTNFANVNRPYKGLCAESEEKHEPASDADAAVVDSLKALDPNRPISEADSCTATSSRLFDHLVGSVQ
jgi:putative tryptophan/tyrosine transport system substrate-binding protein